MWIVSVEFSAHSAKENNKRHWKIERLRYLSVESNAFWLRSPLSMALMLSATQTVSGHLCLTTVYPPHGPYLRVVIRIHVPRHEGANAVDIIAMMIVDNTSERSRLSVSLSLVGDKVERSQTWHPSRLGTKQGKLTLILGRPLPTRTNYYVEL